MKTPAVAPGPGGRPIAVLHAIVPATVGGAERVVEMLAAGQRRRGARVLVAGVTGPSPTTHPFFEALARSGVESERLVVGRRAYVREYRLLADLIARWRPSVVHTHGVRADVIAGRAATATGTPLVSTAHGYITRSRKDRLYQRMQLIGLKGGREVIAVSEALRRRLTGEGVAPGRVHLIPNALGGGADDVLDRRSARERLGIAPDGFVVGFVGRLGHEKGPDVLLEAVPALAADTRVSFVGVGALREELERRATELGISERLAWHGEVAGAGELLPAFDVVVMSSRTEGTPIVALEAMRARVPLVGTAVGGLPDLVRDGREALLVPPERPAALAAAIGALRADARLRRDLVEAAARRLEERYGEGRWLERHDAVYAAAIGGRP